MNATAPALGEVLQRVGALGAAAGLTETRVAALASAMLSAGSSPEIVSTAMRGMLSTLVQGESMSKSAADGFKAIGFSVKQLALDMQTDAQGTIFKVLQAIADKPKELQLSLISDMFGERAVASIAPLLANMGNLTQAFELIGDATAYAGSMQAEFAARSKTTENALQLMRNRFANLSISIGTIFLPVITFAADGLGMIADVLRRIVDSPFGQWLVRATGALAAAVVGITAFSGGLWAVTKITPIVVQAIAPIKAALLGLGWPVLVVIVAIGLLYAAYRSNFGGIADTMNRWYNNIKLIFRGVTAVFESLSGTTGVIRGELAQEIQAAGLVGFVTTLSKVAYRVKAIFIGIRETLDISPALAILAPVGDKIAATFEKLGLMFARVFGSEIATASAGFNEFGRIIGGVVSWGVEALATAVNILANWLGALIDSVRFLVALFTGDWQGACAAAGDIFNAWLDSIMSVADLFRIGDWLRAAWVDALDYLGSISLFDSGARILETLKEGILSAAGSVKDSVKGVFGSIRDLLPFSDAKEGPFSQLTLSGARIMTTLAEGAAQGAGQLKKTMSENLLSVGGTISGWWDDLQGTASNVLSPVIPTAPASGERPEPDQGRGADSRGNTYYITIANLTLPQVKEAKDFMQELADEIDSFGGGSEVTP
jgi:hypothetical protein